MCNDLIVSAWAVSGPSEWRLTFLVLGKSHTSSRITSRRLTQVPMPQFTLRRHIKVLALGGLVLGGIVVLLQACGSTDTKPRRSQITESALDVVQCLEPRPQICTQVYIPVCAIMTDGTKRTYPSGCAACSDPSVVRYRPNRCE